MDSIRERLLDELEQKLKIVINTLQNLEDSLLRIRCKESCNFRLSAMESEWGITEVQISQGQCPSTLLVYWGIVPTNITIISVHSAV